MNRSKRVGSNALLFLMLPEFSERLKSRKYAQQEQRIYMTGIIVQANTRMDILKWAKMTTK